MKPQLQAPLLGVPNHLPACSALPPPNQLSVSNLGSNSRPYQTQTTTKPILTVAFSLSSTCSQSYPNTIEYA